MTEKQQKKAELKWELMIKNPEKAHDFVARGTNGYISAYLAQQILKNEERFFGEMRQKQLSHKEQKNRNGEFLRYGYYKAKHGNEHNRAEESNREEDLNSISLYENYPEIVIDRQTPLRDRSSAKPDLMLYHNKVLFFAEAKKNESEETLLRAVIEIERYCSFVNHEVLIQDFEKACPRLKGKTISCHRVQKAILVPMHRFDTNKRGKKTFSLIDQLESEEYKDVQTLIKKRHIFIINADELNKGEIVFISGYSPKDYEYL